MDLKPYKVFKELKTKYPTRMVRITQKEIGLAPRAQAGQFVREYIAARFKKEHGVEVIRWTHEYSSLDSLNPKLGLVYLASDSHLDQAMEVWGLLGHSVREISEG